MLLITDNLATVQKCWPGRDFGTSVHVQVAPLISTMLAGSGSIGDRPLAWTLPENPSIWNTCLVVAKANGSQYDLLRQSAPDQISGAGNLACLALGGNNFHGQHGRIWQTLAGNLHLSLKVDLDLPSARCSRSLVMLPAVAVMDVLQAAGLPVGKAGIKWVNDILIGGRKVAGVLTSTRTVAGRLVSAVFGIGLNVKTRPPEDPSLHWSGSTALAEHLGDATPDLGPLLDLFLAAMARRLAELSKEGAEPVLDQYREHSLVLGQTVAIWPVDAAEPLGSRQPLHQGRVLEIRSDLSLRIEGVAQPVTRGRLTVINGQNRNP